MKTVKTRKKFRCILFAVLGAVVLLTVAVFFCLPKPQRVSDSSYDLALLDDAVYEGVCENGLVSVRVAVTVSGHKIASIDILEHRNGMGKRAEALAEVITEKQSIEVDAVTGATMSSQSILKAVENALSKG